MTNRTSVDTQTSPDSRSADAVAANPQLAANKQLALEFLQLAFTNQVDAALQKLAPDAQWWVIGRSERLKVSGSKNRAQIERLLLGVARAVPQGMRIELGHVTAEQDRVAVEIAADGVWVNGRPYRNHYHFLLQLRGGMICGIREYMDTLHLLEVMQGE